MTADNELRLRWHKQFCVENVVFRLKSSDIDKAVQWPGFGNLVYDDHVQYRPWHFFYLFNASDIGKRVCVSNGRLTALNIL